MGVSKKSNLEQANLFFPHNVHPSFEATLLLFIDCCFYLYLDKRRFPESLTRNVQLLGTKSASSVDDISAPLTPIMFLLWLYRSLSSTHSLDSSVWTPALRVCLLHFVSVLASLIAKQQSCTKPVSSFWSPFWTSHCLPIASALVVCIAHSTETADCRDASLPYMAQVSAQHILCNSSNFCFRLLKICGKIARLCVKRCRYGTRDGTVTLHVSFRCNFVVTGILV